MTQALQPMGATFDEGLNAVFDVFENLKKGDNGSFFALKDFVQRHCPLPVYSVEASVQEQCDEKLLKALWQLEKEHRNCELDTIDHNFKVVVNSTPFHERLVELWNQRNSESDFTGDNTKAVVRPDLLIVSAEYRDKDFKPVSSVIKYDFRGGIPDKNLYWNHIIAQLLLGKAPENEWGFHNYIIRLLTEMNDISTAHGLKSPLFFNSKSLHRVIESCRLVYLEAQKGKVDHFEILKTPLFQEMVRTNINDLDEDHRRFIKVVSIPMAYKGVGQSMPDLTDNITALLGNSEVADWLFSAFCAKTMPEVIKYNVLAVKGLTDAEMLELSEKRLAVANIWYPAFINKTLTLDDIREFKNSLQDAIKIYDSANDGGFLLPTQLFQARKSYLDLANDPLYNDGRREYYFKSVISNLDTFIVKMEAAAKMAAQMQAAKT